MEIICPSCQHDGTIPDDKIPAVGVTVNCPKCQIKFQVSKPQAPTSKPDFYCPKCGTGQRISESCIKCGIIFSKFINARIKNSNEPETFVTAPTEPNFPSIDEISRTDSRGAASVITNTLIVMATVAAVAYGSYMIWYHATGRAEYDKVLNSLDKLYYDEIRKQNLYRTR